MKSSRSRSLSLQIGLLYLLLALINILFFSVMIFENQSDLLLQNFKLQSDTLVRTVVTDLETVELTRDKDANLEALSTALEGQGIQTFRIFDKEGNIWHQKPESEIKTIPADVKRKSLEFLGDTTLFRSRYSMDIDQSDFSVQFLIPLRANEAPAKQLPAKDPVVNPAAKEGTKIPGRVFLSTRTSLAAIQVRLRELYFQIGLAMIWGVVFHVVFGVFVYRVIFRRLGILKSASEKMSGGDLTVRADWKRTRNDELDELGAAFDTMAGSIQEKVETITTLNAQIQNELEIGREVQNMFLPAKSVLGDAKVAIHFRPMREVSGDVYNFFNLGPKYKGLFFADASGHGVSAALVTTITILSMDSVLKKTIKPDEVVSRMNDLLAQKLESSFYATACYAIFAPGVLAYCNAGHPPPLFVRPSTGRIIRLDKGGPPMGMFEGIPYEAKVLRIESGDRLFFYSDGVTEAANKESVQFGLDRMEAIVKAHMKAGLQETVDAISGGLDAHAAKFDDDVTVLAVEFP